MPTQDDVLGYFNTLSNWGRWGDDDELGTLNHIAEDPGPPGAGVHAPPEANRLIIENPFAFLLAVILDEGIPAERAWRGPYELMLRLGGSATSLAESDCTSQAEGAPC